MTIKHQGQPGGRETEKVQRRNLGREQADACSDEERRERINRRRVEKRNALQNLPRNFFCRRELLGLLALSSCKNPCSSLSLSSYSSSQATSPSHRDPFAYTNGVTCAAGGASDLWMRKSQLQRKFFRMGLAREERHRRRIGGIYFCTLGNFDSRGFQSVLYMLYPTVFEVGGKRSRHKS